MSFSFDFTCVNAVTAREVLKAQYCPDSIKALINQALDGIVGPVIVRAAGHLCIGPGDYNSSNVSITVQPIVYTEVVAPDARKNFQALYVAPSAK